jgi:mobile domain-containing protein
MIWDPYPAYRGDEDEWRVRTPMIFFDVVEYHYPERVMRQYGLRQTRPGPPEDHNQLHEVDRRGKATVNWAAYHRGYIEGWDGREDYVVHGDEIGEPMDFYDDYLIWYRGITRRFISRGYIPDRPLPLDYMPSGVPLHVLVSHFALSFI